jgi:hypothetical protein
MLLICEQQTCSEFSPHIFLREIYLLLDSEQPSLGPVYMEAGLARLARQPGKRDEFLLCLYEKISSRLPGQFCYIDIVLTVVKNSLRRYL